MLALCFGLLVPVHWFFISASGPLQWILVGVMGMLLGATFPVSIVMAQETWTQGVGIASGLVMGLGWVPSGIGSSVTGMIADRSSLEVGLRTLVVPVLIGLGFIVLYGAVSRRAMAKQEEALPA
jgi:FSR family fosmidomycin resistance protein-like MFS transporter